MSNSNRWTYKISSICAAQPGSYAAFLDPDTDTVVKSRVLVWATIDWYNKTGDFLDSEIVGMSPVDGRLALELNDYIEDDFICYMFADEEIPEEIVDSVRGKRKEKFCEDVDGSAEGDVP